MKDEYDFSQGRRGPAPLVSHEAQYKATLAYLHTKVAIADWASVIACASELRVIEALAGPRAALEAAKKDREDLSKVTHAKQLLTNAVCGLMAATNPTADLTLTANQHLAREAAQATLDELGLL